MKLIDTLTGLEAKIGHVYQGYTLTHFAPPHKPSSSGKCTVNNSRELYVGVLGLKWIEREDRDEPNSSVAASGRPKSASDAVAVSGGDDEA